MSIRALPSRIVRVTVLRNAALATREAELDLATAGPEVVRLAGLPLALDESSVRVRVEPLDGAGPPPEATDARVVLETPDPDPSLAPPHDEELRAARREVLRLQDRAQHFAAGISRLRVVSSPPRPDGEPGSPPPPSPTAARLALLDFRGEELERLGSEITAVEEQLRSARQRLELLEQRDRAASTARAARPEELRTSIVVRLEAPEGVPPAGRCRLVAEYLVPGARWAPTYAVRFDRDLGRAELTMRALVCQASGEDWTGVRLAVSTADPQRWTELPELPALRIGRRQPPPARTGWREPPTGAEALFADYDRARAELRSAAAAAPTMGAGLAPQPFAGALVEAMAREAQPEAEAPAPTAETEDLLLDDVRRVPAPPPMLPRTTVAPSPHASAQKKSHRRTNLG